MQIGIMIGLNRVGNRVCSGQCVSDSMQHAPRFHCSLSKNNYSEFSSGFSATILWLLVTSFTSG